MNDCSRRPTDLPATLREYAVIADGERGVVVGPDGDCAFLCFPSWESDAVFAGLLGGAGGYGVRPVDRRVWGGYYEDRSLIWRRRWITMDAEVECREALARPAEPGRAVLLRQLRGVRGRARLEADLDVRAGFGRSAMTGVRRDDDGAWTGRSGQVRFRWIGAPTARHSGGPLTADLEVAEGQTLDLVLELADGDLGPPIDAARAWAATEADWRSRVPACDDTLTPRDAQLAYAVLTGLTSRQGGMAAAATTSLPEHVGADRNYDYRYAWIRDQCYAALAVAEHGGDLTLLDSAVGFVAERLLADGDRLRPAYTVGGDPVPGPQKHDLAGYPGSNVITGNRARDQFQLDAFGEALQLFARAAQRDRLPAEAERAARLAVEAIARHRDEPDFGMWETTRRLWTHSRLACAAGLKAAADHLASRAEAGRWRDLAEAIVKDATRTSLHPAGYWHRAPDDEGLDAALLVPGVRGALASDDPRNSATVQAVRDRLVEEGFVYRYKADDAPLGEAEGSFLLCGFLLALAELQQGERARAWSRFERIRSGCGTTGLFAEEYDVAQRQLRGNLPQAFVHALLLETSTCLAGAVSR